ncbi:MarR family winged helix-turn-helix transcriptional regulator [Streptomyces sp. NBC_01304]|uniref:MarR family winged helix-turn-helix transcriptional regulator n=1 Tax=Streptomyces sp. NBC_01304 TaxID=2903818 RepID=UPI002E155E2E|nr:MarR family transcriptional regulator [Streptomyces sp. NBC_01304]
MSASRKASEAPDAVDAIIDQWNSVRPELDVEAMAVFGRIARITAKLQTVMDRTYGQFGINRGEFDVLATLRRADEPYTLSPRQLSATLMLTTGGMTGRLDKLERAGLLARSPDPNDRRGLQVTLTEKGLALIEEAVVAGLEVRQAILTSLDDRETEQLNGLLRTLLAATNQA